MRLILGANGEGLTLTAPPYSTEGLTACVLGNKGSGKSNTMAVIAEEMHRNQIPFIYYDPNGDCLSLAELGDDVLTLGNPDHPDPARRANYPLRAAHNDPRGFIQMVLADGYSLAVDLSAGPEETGLELLAALLRMHYHLAGHNRRPAGLFVDEAWRFAPQSKGSPLETATKAALRQISFDGRKRGMMLTVATQRITYLDKALVFGCNLRIFGKITYWPDYEAIKHYIPATFHQLRNLESGEAWLTAAGAMGKLNIKRRATPDLGQTPAFTVAPGPRPNKQNLQLRCPAIRQLSLLPPEE